MVELDGNPLIPTFEEVLRDATRPIPLQALEPELEAFQQSS
jgi:hypothetical protein